MLDLLPLATSFASPKLSLGYRKLAHQSDLPFSTSLAAHEFHYARVDWMGETAPLFVARNASGKEIGTMGQRLGSVHGSFAHLIAPREN